MPDPTAILASLALSEVYRVGKDAVVKAYDMEKLAKQLDKDYLQELLPIVQGTGSMVDSMNPDHEDVRRVMEKLEKDLVDLKELASRCSQPGTRNPFKRWSNSKKIIKAKEKIQVSQILVTYLSLKMHMATVVSASAPASSFRFHCPSIPQHQVVVGMGDYMLKLQSLLLDERGNQWICVSGMGGVGKTLLVQLVCNDSEVRDHFQGRILWVRLGPDPQVIEYQRDLCEHISRRPARLLQDESDGRMVLSNLVSKKRYLVILDNAWTRNILEPFDIIGNHNGSKLVVTSRKKDILDDLGARASRIDVEGLSYEDSYSLFCHHAFQERAAPANLESYVRRLVSRCDGVPLVVEVVATAMAPKREPREWESVLKKLVEGKFQGQQHVFEMLRLSYDRLDTFHQKCFLLFAARTKGACCLNGFGMKCLQMPDDNDDDDDDFEMDSQEALRSLGKASLLKVHTRWRYCPGQGPVMWDCSPIWRMDNLLYELANYIIDKDKLPYVFSARKTSSMNWQSLEMVSLGPGLQSLPEIRGGPATKLRILMLAGDFEVAENDFDLLPNLKVLMLWSRSVKAPPDRLGDLKHLQVLHCDYLPRSLGDLHNLVVAYFRISPSVHIGNLSTALHQLTKLEVLNLELCRISHIDLSFLKSTSKLRHLRIIKELGIQEEDVTVALNATSCFHIKNLFDLEELRLWCKTDLLPVSTFQSLTKLEYFEVYEIESVVDWECQNLINLKTFQVRRSPKIFTQCMLDSLFRSALSLEYLTLPLEMEFGKVPPLDNLHSLKELQVSLAVRCLPHSFGSSQTFPLLRKLRLNGCGLLAELPSPEKLPNLSHLELLGCAFEHLSQAFGQVEAFPALDTLKIKDCKAVVELPALDRLRNLKHLALEGFSALDHLPALDRLQNLITLTLQGFSSLEHFPGSSDAFPHLLGLSLEECPLPDLSPGALPELGDLTIRRCRMKHLPESLTVLTGLRSLSLTDCHELETLVPDETTFTPFMNLEELSLVGSTRLQSLPLSVATLPRLRVLDVRSCSSLTSICSGAPNPECFFPKLEILHVRGSGVVVVPKNLEERGCLRDDGMWMPE